MQGAMTVRRRSFLVPLAVLALASLRALAASPKETLVDRLRWPEGHLSLAALTRALVPALRHRIQSELLLRAPASPPASARAFLDDTLLYDDFDDTERYHDADKRQYPDYGHLRFGKRAEFGDYGHLRFGRSQDATDRQGKDTSKTRQGRAQESSE